MPKNDNIVRKSDKQMQTLRDAGQSQSDWHAAESLSQADIERLADEDDGPLPANWAATVEIGIPVTKQAIHLRLDRDVLGWFRARGPGYQTRINAVLRAFMQARQDGASGKQTPR